MPEQSRIVQAAMTQSAKAKGKPAGTARPRAWQRMLSGRRLDLIDPSPVDVEITDIAHGLARVARWNGQTSGNHPFSVAQHSLLVLEIADRIFPPASPDKRLMALLHDAPEYVVGDLIAPFKAVLGDDYKAVEERLLTAVHLRFGLPAATPLRWRGSLKKADMCAAYFEATHLAGFSQAEALRFFGKPALASPPRGLIEPMTPSEAQRRFLDTFASIEAARR